MQNLTPPFLFDSTFFFVEPSISLIVGALAIVLCSLGNLTLRFYPFDWHGSHYFMDGKYKPMYILANEKQNLIRTSSKET